ncbi:hypothetical protein K438DRAFT_1954459 [Mycena galopus ATCC 62051]|nr:hypothetical protein K438DRAFT_1954459 [Mycena galopus ATCC 62051]
MKVEADPNVKPGGGKNVTAETEARNNTIVAVVVERLTTIGDHAATVKDIRAHPSKKAATFLKTWEWVKTIGELKATYSLLEAFPGMPPHAKGASKKFSAGNWKDIFGRGLTFMGHADTAYTALVKIKDDEQLLLALADTFASMETWSMENFSNSLQNVVAGKPLVD